MSKRGMNENDGGNDSDNNRESKKQTQEQIAAQADKIAHLPDVKCNCSGCLNTPTYLNEQLTNIYAQLNAQNKLIQEQSNIQTVILKDLIPLLKEIDAKLSK